MPNSSASDFKQAIDPLVGKVGDDLVEALEEISYNPNKIANGGRSPSFSIIKPKLRKYWLSYLTKRGIKVEVGTNKANEILDKVGAYGLFERKGYNYEFNTYKEATIYLREPPSTSAFLEETYHALQHLKGVSSRADIVHEGILYENIDNWEYLAKKRLLDESLKSGMTYEEVIFIEEQLRDVLRDIY